MKPSFGSLGKAQRSIAVEGLQAFDLGRVYQDVSVGFQQQDDRDLEQFISPHTGKVGSQEHDFRITIQQRANGRLDPEVTMGSASVALGSGSTTEAGLDAVAPGVLRLIKGGVSGVQQLFKINRVLAGGNA